MPYRTIRPCIFPDVKPFQLIAALMHREGLGALPLAKRLGKPSLQPQIHRFSRGEVANPARSTAVPLANYFGIPVDAIYEEKVATTIAKERGLSVVPMAVRRANVPSVTLSRDALTLAATYARKKIDDADASEEEREFHRAVRAAYEKLVAEDPDGLTGTTRPSPLDDAGNVVPVSPERRPLRQQSNHRQAAKPPAKRIKER